jgi:hypothetical protein
MLTGKALANFGERIAFLNCRRLPARLNSGETALLLGVQEHDIAPLIASKMLAVLGKPAPNAPKYFAAVDVMARAENAEWLSQATRTLARFWQVKNQRKNLSALQGSAAA